MSQNGQFRIENIFFDIQCKRKCVLCLHTLIFFFFLLKLIWNLNKVLSPYFTREWGLQNYLVWWGDHWKKKILSAPQGPSVGGTFGIWWISNFDSHLATYRPTVHKQQWHFSQRLSQSAKHAKKERRRRMKCGYDLLDYQTPNEVRKGCVGISKSF